MHVCVSPGEELKHGTVTSEHIPTSFSFSPHGSPFCSTGSLQLRPARVEQFLHLADLS